MDAALLLLHPLIGLVTNPHVQIVLSSLYIITLLSKFFPALRVLGVFTQSAALFLTLLTHYAKTHPDAPKNLTSPLVSTSHSPELYDHLDCLGPGEIPNNHLDCLGPGDIPGSHDVALH